MKSYHWTIKAKIESDTKSEEIINSILKTRGLLTKKDRDGFLNPPPPEHYKPKDIGVNAAQLKKSLERIKKAIKNKEKIIIYGDYDADGICSSAIMWETLKKIGADVLPYIPKRLEEGYGLSKKGIDILIAESNPSLIITVDQGITALEEVKYAVAKKIDVIIIDHHVKPSKLPRAHSIVHTTYLCAAGLSWYVANALKKFYPSLSFPSHLDLAAIGTIADMVPLTLANRSLAKYGLNEINNTTRLGIEELIKEAGLKKGEIGTYEIGFIIAPRLNAMGRLEHALDSLRLLCAVNPQKARELALHLGQTNRVRQQLTFDTSVHAKNNLKEVKKLIFISNTNYEQGVIGLVAGKLVDEYYRPSIVVSKGEIYSKASARSISGFNIIEAIRNFESLLINAGGHPMAAGFTVETSKLELLKTKLEDYAASTIEDNLLNRILKIDLEIDLFGLNWDLFNNIQSLEPYGIGNPEPIFASQNCQLVDIRLVGAEKKHLKLGVKSQAKDRTKVFSAIAFGMGELADKLKPGQNINIAYNIYANIWNGNKSLELRIKDIKQVVE